MIYQSGFSALNKAIRVVTMMLVGTLMVACMDDSNSTQDAKPATKTIRKDFSYGSRGSDTSWPRMPEGAVATADNLLAKNYMVVLDASGSMQEGACTNMRSKLDEAKAAIMAFGESLGADANLGLLYFSGSGIQKALPISQFSAAALESAIKGVIPGGSTPLADAMSTGFDALTEQARKQLGNGQYNLVVVTDGAANPGQNVVGEVDKVINTSPVMIHAIGFCIGTNHALNQAGKTRYVAASDGASLRQGLAAVLAESQTFDVSAFSAVQ